VIVLIKLPNARLCIGAFSGMERVGLMRNQQVAPRACQRVDGEGVYLYVALDSMPAVDGVSALQAALQAEHRDAACVLLERTLICEGASAGRTAEWHYVVETDVRPEAEADFNAWYDIEHMPGLAAVPGTVRAQRYVSRYGQPAYYATYDLETRETFGSEPWLQVRGTDWSSRVRPNFMNTTRTMFRHIAIPNEE
jgi:hypothetical protein